MAQRKKIYLLLGHSDCDSFTGKLADEYERGACEAGFTVRRTNICDIDFDPILHKGYKEIQELEPGLKKVQQDMKWCDHFVLFYPNWWGTMPAVLKGMFDRMFLPGFAFRFHKKGWGWDKLLEGRTAHVSITMNTHPFLAWILYGDNSNEIKRNILEFAGFHPVRLKKAGPVEKMSEEGRQRMKRQAYIHGKEGK